MTVDQLASPTSAPGRGQRLPHVLLSEWTKFRTLRSIRFTMLATPLLAAGFGALFSAGTGENYPTLPLEDKASFDPTSTSLVGGMIFSELALGILGVLIVTSEYSTQMIRTSLAVVPRRSRFVAAKALLLGLVALVLSEITAFGAFLLCQPVLASEGAPRADLGDPGVLRAVVGSGLFLALVGLLGVALGFLLRSTSGAISVLVTLTLIFYMIAALLPHTFVKYWPTLAGFRITTTRPDPTLLSPWAGLGLMALFVAVLLAITTVVFRGRDA